MSFEGLLNCEELHVGAYRPTFIISYGLMVRGNRGGGGVSKVEVILLGSGLGLG